MHAYPFDEAGEHGDEVLAHVIPEGGGVTQGRAEQQESIFVCNVATVLVLH